MTAVIQFDFPAAWALCLLLAAAAGLVLRNERRRGLSAGRAAVLGVLRFLALLPLVFLAARPFWTVLAPAVEAERRW